MIRRPVSPLRRFIAVLLIVSILSVQPTRAHAFLPAVLTAAVAYVATELMSVFTGDGTLKSVLLVLETQLPIMLSSIDMKINENLSKANAAVHREQKKRESQLASVRQHPADILQANCQAMTGLADVNVATTVSTTVYQPLMNGEFKHLENRGGSVSGRGVAHQTDRSLSTDPLRQKLEEYNNHVCRYATENDLKAAIAAGCKKPDGTAIKTLADIKANPYQGADTRATILLNTQAFDEDRHFLAASDYCYALTGNQPLNYAQGRALSEDLGNIKQFMGALSDKSARDLSAFTCLDMVRRKLPLNTTFAITDPALGKLITDSKPETGGRTSADISKAAKAYLHDGEGYSEVKPSERDPDAVAKGGQQQLIEGQQVSLQQNDEAIYVARWSAPEFANKVKGVQGLLWSRVANMQLMWRQYQQLERQTLTEAIELTRLVRGAPGYGDPPASSAAR